MRGDSMKKRVFGIFLIFSTFFLITANYSKAVNYDKKIQEEEQKKKEYEKKADGLEEEMKEVEGEKEDTLSFIKKLDKKTEKLEADVAQLEAEEKETRQQLTAAQNELSAAQEEKEKQYSTMKKRIKYMYENGNSQYLEILFGASSITDLLSRSEYVEKIAEYDNQIFVRFEETCQEIEKREKEIQQALEKVSRLVAEKKEETQEMNELTQQKQYELDKYNKQLSLSKEKWENYNKQAVAAENAVENLLKKKQEEMEKEQTGETADSSNNGSMIWPLPNGAGRISSSFGPRKSPTAGASSYHKGIDIAATSGTPIWAAAGGKVITAAYSSSAGNYVMISHGNRLYTVYMHCSRLAVKEGDNVKRKQVIAYVGSTGISTGAHLHFGVSKDGSYVNPLNYVSK